MRHKGSMMKSRNLFVWASAGALLAVSLQPVAAAESAAKPAAKSSPPASADGWRSLFDGKTLKGWKEADFFGKGPVVVTNGMILLKSGYMTGITWANTNDLIRMNYELSLDAKRVEGSDFFCGLTFPVGPDAVTLIAGGWGGSLVGLSCLDGEDAANNETTTSMEFKQDQWYFIRVQVKPNRITAWIDGEKMVDVDTTDRRVGVRLECEPCVPLGIATWSTTGAVRDIKVRPLAKAEK